MAAKLKLAMLLILVTACCRCGPGTPVTHETISIGGENWLMELAVTEDSIRRGLMDREEIPAGTGMLFLFPRSEPREFWMGHCLTDIDIIFVDVMGRITAVHEMKALPLQHPEESDSMYRLRMPGYPSVFPVRAAMEFPPGTIARLGLQPGQSTGLDMRRLEEIRAAAIAWNTSGGLDGTAGR